MNKLDKLKEDLAQAAIVAMAYADISGWLIASEFGGYEISIKAHRLNKMTKSNIESEKAKRDFDVLVKEWKEATAHFSSVRQQIGHLSFLRIAVLGEKALPFILDELRREPIPAWLSVLEAFAGKDIAENATTYREAVECWLNWGKGYLSII